MRFIIERFASNNVALDSAEQQLVHYVAFILNIWRNHTASFTCTTCVYIVHRNFFPTLFNTHTSFIQQKIHNVLYSAFIN